MDAGDILKIVGLIAFFVIQGVFGAKNKKKKEEEARKRAIAQAEAEADFQQYQIEQPSETVVEVDSFFDEVKRMIEAEERQQVNKDTAVYFDSNVNESVPTADFVGEDYFEKKHRENETEFFAERIPAPVLENTSQTVNSTEAAINEIANTPPEVSTSLKKSTKKKRGLNLKKAIIYQTILEQKYS